MTTHERFTRMFDHREADRIPIIDSSWATTVARWKREGMPEAADFRDYFGLDKTVFIGADNSPRFEEKVLEETDRYVVFTTKWGATQGWWIEAAFWFGFDISPEAASSRPTTAFPTPSASKTSGASSTTPSAWAATHSGGNDPDRPE